MGIKHLDQLVGQTDHAVARSGLGLSDHRIQLPALWAEPRLAAYAPICCAVISSR
jgi:hypothetical protein